CVCLFVCVCVCSLMWCSVYMCSDGVRSGSSVSGTLTQFMLVLYGSGTDTVDTSSPDLSQANNGSCKTFDLNQNCIGKAVSLSLSVHQYVCVCVCVCVWWCVSVC